MSTMREENRSLKVENANLNRQKSELEASVKENVQQLQLQMMNAVKVAVDKTTSLQLQLQERNSRVEELERQLSQLRCGALSAHVAEDQTLQRNL